MSSNIPPPSPAGPRSASVGPNGTLPTPTTTAVVNGVGPAAGTAAPAASSSATPLSQQNLNQIVSVCARHCFALHLRTTDPTMTVTFV